MIFVRAEHHAPNDGLQRLIVWGSGMNEPRTLPELLNHTEKLARQLMEHLQYDVGPKAQRLVDATRPEPATLADCEEFTARLYREWVACSKRIDTLANELAAELNP